jgi:hypothetical protein
MMFSQSFSAFVLIALAVCAQAVSAQSFNVDAGYDVVSVPSAGYGAAAAQPGVWNGVRQLPTALNDTAGVLTGVIISGQPISAFTGGFSNNPGTTGDDQLLMDDSGFIGDGVGASSTITFSGLQAGVYTVYTYAWRATQPTWASASVDVNGVGAQVISPVLDVFAGFVQGENYLRHRVTIAEGNSLNILITVVSDQINEAYFAGFQVVKQGNEVFDDGFESPELP